MRLVGVAVVLGLCAVPNSARAGGDAIGWPPMKLDIGALTFADENGTYTGGQLLLGINWATVYPKSTRFDIGLGYVGATMQDPRPRVTTTKLTAGPPRITLHGGYLELSTRLAKGSHWRSWLSTRGELSSVDGEPALGGALRLSAEVWDGVMVGGRNGLLVGVLAVGVWAEASLRELDDHAAVAAASAGLSFRLPLGVIGK